MARRKDGIKNEDYGRFDYEPHEESQGEPEETYGCFI
jgi:hypothetical protein